MLFIFATLYACGGDSKEAAPVLDGDLSESEGDSAEDDADTSDGETYAWDDHALVAMSYNIMCSMCGPTPSDGLKHDKWSVRVAQIADVIARHKPDLLGTQEFIFASEVEQIRSVVPQYATVFAKDAIDDPTYPEVPDSTIFYLRERFTLLDEGYFWLSPTPDSEEPSMGWSESQATARLVIWARLRQISDGRELVFATTHFDNNQPNQEHSASLVIERAAVWAENAAVILVGDFNSNPSTLAYSRMATGIDGAGFHFQNAYTLAGSYTIDTNQTPEPAYDPTQCIDHIWLAGKNTTWGATSWTVDLHVYSEKGLYPSDHRAVLSAVTW